MKKGIVAAIAAAGLLVLCSFGSFAATVIQTVSSPAEGCILAAIDGSYNGDAQAALDYINEIRYEACQQGVRDPRNESRSLTLSDYVPIQWSSSLEYIARVRAAEASIYRGHTRPNRKKCFTVLAPDGKQSYAEDLAWNWNHTIVSGIEQWYDEKYDWDNQTGFETGHYTSMINPYYKYVGLASFTNPDGGYPNTVSAEFDGYYTHNTDMGGAISDARVITEFRDTDLSSASLQVLSEEHQRSGKLDKNDTLQYALMLNVKYGGVSTPVYDVGDISWSSSDPGVAAVDASGRVVIGGEGKATITAISSSGQSASTVLMPAHIPMRVDAVPATCTKAGLTEGKRCAVCGEVMTQQLIVPALGHKPRTLAAVAATCTKTGLTEGSKCSICGEILTPQ